MAGISIGGIDLVKQGIDNEYRIIVLEKIVERILNKSPGIISQEEVTAIRDAAIAQLSVKYPLAGITKKGA